MSKRSSHLVAFIFACLLFIAGSSAFAAPEVTPVKSKTVEFDGQTYKLASEKSGVNASISEYLPAGQNLEHWKELVAVRVLPHIESPQAYAKSMDDNLKKTTPGAQSSMIAKDDGSEVILDFVVWSSSGENITEFNLWRFIKQPQGIIAYQYARRSYEEDAVAFFSEVKAMRRHWIDVMTKAKF